MYVRCVHVKKPHLMLPIHSHKCRSIFRFRIGLLVGRIDGWIDGWRWCLSGDDEQPVKFDARPGNIAERVCTCDESLLSFRREIDEKAHRFDGSVCVLVV